MNARTKRSITDDKVVVPIKPKRQSKSTTLKSEQLHQKRLHILDTNVLLHDPTSPLQFAEHDILFTPTVLEELDHIKKGDTELARNAREATRLLSQIIEREEADVLVIEGIGRSYPMNHDGVTTRGRLLFYSANDLESSRVFKVYSETKPDHWILATAERLKENFEGSLYEKIILVSQDINIRLKAETFEIKAEAYLADVAIADANLLSTGMIHLSEEYWENLIETNRNEHGPTATYRLLLPENLTHPTFYLNHLVHNGKQQQFIIRQIHEDYLLLERCKNYMKCGKKNDVFATNSRNRGQNFLYNILLDPTIKVVSVLGVAGTGKTLPPIATALEQYSGLALNGHTKHPCIGSYSRIVMTRLTISMDDMKDIGYLPGTEEEKLAPWMGALSDNLEVISEHIIECEFTLEDRTIRSVENTQPRVSTPRALEGQIGSHFVIKALNLMRGRTFLNTFLIIDEAQNLTSKQLKSVIARVGERSKIIIIGNLEQIDTKYLSSRTSGLTYVTERLKGKRIFANVILDVVERGEVAKLVDEFL